MAAIINIAIIFMCISIYKPSETCKPFLVDIVMYFHDDGGDFVITLLLCF